MFLKWMLIWLWIFILADIFIYLILIIGYLSINKNNWNYMKKFIYNSKWSGFFYKGKNGVTFYVDDKYLKEKINKWDLTIIWHVINNKIYLNNKFNTFYNRFIVFTNNKVLQIWLFFKKYFKKFKNYTTI